MTKGYLLDTNFISYLYKSSSPLQNEAKNFLGKIKDDHDLVFTSSVCIAEIENGFRLADRLGKKLDEKHQQKIRECFRSMIIIDISKDTAEYYAMLKSALICKFAPRTELGEIRKQDRKYIDDYLCFTNKTGCKKLGVTENDIWIAAQSMERNLVLVTNDKMHRISEATNDVGLRFCKWHASDLSFTQS